jgi:Protein of unknown function (DUF3570)
VRSRVLGFLLSCCGWLLASGSARADGLSSGVFVRTDNDHTVVVSPRAHVSKTVADTTVVDVSYAADIWTSASVDIRASATKPVTEQRDELDAAVGHSWDDLTVTGAYRYSIEHDYVSHGVTATGSLDLAQNNTTLAASAFAFFDNIGRAGAPTFHRDLTTAGARATFTQVLGVKTLGQLSYELGHLQGYQASPYRMVGFGGTGFGCEGSKGLCLAEHEPERRTRHAMALVLRHAISEAFSAGVSYRLYLDDWGLISHTLSAQLAWMLSELTQITLHYRFYIQGGVDFYRMIYPVEASSGAFTTRDREQSPMHDQRIGLELQQLFPIDERGTRLALRASVGGLQYDYSAFAGLRSVRALEVSFALGLEN